MKALYLFLFLLTATLYSSEKRCTALKTEFEKEEEAYKMLKQVAVASESAYLIVGRFVDKGINLLETCPKVYSLDRQYTLKRELKKAYYYRNSFKVFSQEEVRGYAISHPQEKVIYKWGTVRISP